ncbi:MAG: MlaC/ttg2D family ABC transporter substrate-binding protein [Gammaproteobacteria bacterium]
MCKIRLIPLILLVLAIGAGAAVAATAPAEQAKITVDAIIDALNNGGLDKQTQREKIGGLIAERFDFRNMSQRVLAKNWRKASDGEKERFVELFSQLLINTYLGRIKAYTDERVEFVDEKIRKEKYALVDTLIVTSDKEIPVDYKMILRGDQWRVYDVVIEEVSLVSSYRSSYLEIVQKEGIEGLLAQMQAKLDQRAAN